jgi:hypothetical protein
MKELLLFGLAMVVLGVDLFCTGDLLSLFGSAIFDLGSFFTELSA